MALCFNDNLHFGYLKYYNYKQGYGFVMEDGIQYFFHITSLIPHMRAKEIELGMEATFSVMKLQDGREYAIDVILTERSKK